MSREQDLPRPGCLVAEIVVPWLPKSGNADAEYEDAFAFDEAWQPSVARLAVADGASEAYDSQTWVRLLVSSFVDRGGPTLDRANVRSWLLAMQRSWWSDTPDFSSVVEEAKYQDGSFGTFLGVELRGIGGDHDGASWVALAVGDTALFHIRDGELAAMFPEMTAKEFAEPPELVNTKPQLVERTLERMKVGHGSLRDGDTILVSTDALAEWAVARQEFGDPPWGALANVGGCGRCALEQLVEELRAANEIKNDDVTLLVARITSQMSAVGSGQ